MPQLIKVMAELDNTLNQMDPDAGDYFGVPSSPEQSQLVLVSVPWDATGLRPGPSRRMPPMP